MQRVAALACAAACALAGCGGDAASTSTGTDTITVYSVLPLEGAQGRVMRDLVDGQKLALRQAHGQVGGLTVNFRSVDSAEDGVVTPASAAAAGRKAAQDLNTIAAIGVFGVTEARTVVPLLNEASVAVATPGVTYNGLTSERGAQEPGEPERLYPSGQRTLARIVGDDVSQARAAVALAAERGCRRLAVVRGESDADRSLAQLVEQALAGRRTIARGEASDRSSCVFVAIGAPAPAARAVDRLAREHPDRALLGPWAIAGPAFAEALDPAAARSARLLMPLPGAGAPTAAAFARTFGRPPSTHALMGHDAMRAVLAAVRQAGKRGNDRAVVAQALGAGRPAPWGAAAVRDGRVGLARRIAPAS